MKRINNFEKNRRELKKWLETHEIFAFNLMKPVKVEVFYPGNRNEDSVPDIAFCQKIMFTPRIYNGKVYRFELSFKDINGRDICHNDLCDGNFYKDVLNEIKLESFETV